MEYFLKINRVSKQFEGNLPLNIAGSLRYGYEGYVYDDLKGVVGQDGPDYSSVHGVFNLFILKQGESCRIINDKLGQLNLFYVIDDSEIYFSNNFWSLLRSRKPGFDALDFSELRRFIFFIGSHPEHRTFVKDIRLFPPATVFSYDFASDRTEFRNYWTLQRNGGTCKLEQAAEQAYAAIDNNFSKISAHFPDREFLFGNSGGLDSRLIPYFSQRHGLRTTGFTVATKRNRLGLRTATYIASRKIQKHYGFEQHYFPRQAGDYGQRLLLDIRNAPVTSCNMLDNPYERLSGFNDHVLIQGNPAYFIGQSRWTVARGFGDSVSWNYFIFYLLRIWELSQRKLRTLAECIDIDSYLATAEAYRPFFEKYKHLGYIGLFQHVHHCCMDFTAHSGGFESVNRTRISLDLYYPYLDTCSAEWSDELMMDRKVLKELNRRVNPNLHGVHDQEFKYNGKPNPLVKLIRKVEERFSLRTSGMELHPIQNERHFLEFAHVTMSRKNPLFDTLGNPELILDKLIRSDEFPPEFSLNFLKVKRMLDIIYYKEYDVLDRASFSIV